MKRMQSIPIETIVIIVIALAVGILIILFFSGVLRNGIANTNTIQNATTQAASNASSVLTNISSSLSS